MTNGAVPGGEVATLDDLVGEVTAAARTVEDLDTALRDLKAWAMALPGRWPGVKWGTDGLEMAIAGVAHAAAELDLLEDVVDQIRVINAEVAIARGLGETASEVRAHGDLAGFQTTATPAASAWVDPEGERLSRQQDVELAIEKAYRMIVLLAEEDGVVQQWVGLAQLRARVDQDRLRDRLAVFPPAEVDAALERLAGQPGIHLQEEDNQQALTAADRAAAVRFGGIDRHLFQIVEQASCLRCGQEMDAGEVEFCGCDEAEVARVQAELTAAQPDR